MLSWLVLQCVGPGEVLCDVYTQELGAAHSLHGRTIDGQRSRWISLDHSVIET